MPQISTAARNGMLNGLIAAIGSSPVIHLRTGGEPSLDNDDTGTLLASFTLGGEWAAAASGGAIELVTSAVGSGVPVVASAIAAANGVAGHWRLLSSTGTAHLSGSVSEAGGGGDIVLDSVTIIAGIPVYITSWFLYTRSSV